MEMSCGDIAKKLEKTPMQIGRVRNEVCKKSDLNGKLIKPSGIQKICRHLNFEMDVVENASPDIVKVSVLKQPVANPRWICAKDLGRDKKIFVNVPKNRKKILSKPRTVLNVRRGSENGEFYYQWMPNL